MSISFELAAEERTQTGTGASRRLRRENKLPAVLYGGGKDPQSITLDHETVLHQAENESFYSQILTINIGKNKERAIIKEVLRHPYKPKLVHIDLQRVSDTEKVRVNVPLHFVGEDKAPGVKLSKGIVNHLMTNIEISCLAKDLPEFIEVDLSELKENESAHVSDIKLPAGIEIPALATGNDQPVASIHVPRGVGEETAAASPAAEASEEPKES